MPYRMPAFVSPEMRAARAARDKTRPNAAQRGYCSKGWRSLRKQALLRDAWRCRDCGKVCIGPEAHVDHIVPKSQGGADTLENCQTLCISCHSTKTAREFKLGWTD
jgi:5-methylcytosine-specific restriction protein A